MSNKDIQIPQISDRARNIMRAAYLVGKPLLHLYYGLSIKGLDKLEPYKDSGFLLLPKHQRKLDIFLEGCLLQRAFKRSAYYIMKGSLTEWLEDYGGIPIYRGRDILHLSNSIDDPEKRKQFKTNLLEKAKQKRDEEIPQVISTLLKRGEIVVYHPEGKFKSYKQFQPHRPNLERIVQIQSISKDPIPIIPLSIVFGSKNKYRPRTGIRLKVGEPLYDQNLSLKTLTNHLIDQIEV